jgi:hypothetical protein
MVIMVTEPPKSAKVWALTRLPLLLLLLLLLTMGRLCPGWGLTAAH